MLSFGMNGFIADFPTLSEVLASGKESLPGAQKETSYPRSFKDDSSHV